MCKGVTIHVFVLNRSVRGFWFGSRCALPNGSLDHFSCQPKFRYFKCRRVASARWRDHDNIAQHQMANVMKVERNCATCYYPAWADLDQATLLLHSAKTSSKESIWISHCDCNNIAARSSEKHSNFSVINRSKQRWRVNQEETLCHEWTIQCPHISNITMGLL